MAGVRWVHIRAQSGHGNGVILERETATELPSDALGLWEVVTGETVWLLDLDLGRAMHRPQWNDEASLVWQWHEDWTDAYRAPLVTRPVLRVGEPWRTLVKSDRGGVVTSIARVVLPEAGALRCEPTPRPMAGAIVGTVVISTPRETLLVCISIVASVPSTVTRWPTALGSTLAGDGVPLVLIAYEEPEMPDAWCHLVITPGGQAVRRRSACVTGSRWYPEG